MTPEEIAAMKKGLETANAAIAALQPLAAEVTTLKTSLAAKDTEIADLKKTVNPLSLNSATLALKSAYPDVPEASLLAVVGLPAESQKAVLEPMQKTAADFKVTLAKNDPTAGWADAGSIAPSTDAEKLARKTEREQAYRDQAKTGNVFGMLEERGAEIAAHVRRALTPSRS